MLTSRESLKKDLCPVTLLYPLLLHVQKNNINPNITASKDIHKLQKLEHSAVLATVFTIQTYFIS